MTMVQIQEESDQDIQVERIRKRPRDLAQEAASSKRIKTCDLPYNLQVFEEIVAEEPLDDEEEDAEQASIDQVQKEPQDPFLMSKSAFLDDLTTARSCIQARLSGTIAMTEPVRLDDSYAKLSCSLERMMKDRQGGSILLMGPRGTGKTMLVKKVLEETRKAHARGDERGPFLEIHLNGFVQTDDKTALREIVRQLNLTKELCGQKLGSFAECLEFILYALKGEWSSLPIVFVLEELDLFALHPKQTLLYNLLDLSQTSSTPIFVLGTTSKIDAIELFEKRVRSRFSHQILYLYAPDTLSSFMEIPKSCMLLQKKDLVRDEKYMQRFNKSVEDKEVIKVFKKIFDLNRDIRQIKSICVGFEKWSHPQLSAVCMLTENSPVPRPKDILSVAESQFVDYKAKVVSSLSVLEVCLLVGVKHRLDLQEEQFNFEMVYDNYREFTQRMSTWGRSVNLFYIKPVAHKAFERLLELELIKYTDGAAAKGPKEHRMVKSLLTRESILDAVIDYAQDLPDAVMKWAESS